VQVVSHKNADNYNYDNYG